MVGVGPGSSEQDYAAVGIDFSERWARLDEAVQALRALVASRQRAVRRPLLLDRGRRPRAAPAQPYGPADLDRQLGVRRRPPARRPPRRRLAGVRVQHHAQRVRRTRGRACASKLPGKGRDAETFPNALGDDVVLHHRDRAEADAIYGERLVPTIHRPEEMLRERLPVGPPEAFAEKLAAFRDAGVQRVFIWPVADERRQLELFVEQVVPLLGG